MKLAPVVITWAELRAHDAPTDCWVAVHGRALDVTAFLAEHPGGPAALSKAGRAGHDVTSHFERLKHSAAARAMLAGMQVGIMESTAEEGTEGSIVSRM